MVQSVYGNAIAGFVPPSPATLDAISEVVETTQTPWIGEHLAFLSAEGLGDDSARATPTELTYTVCPQLSDETIERVGANLDRLRQR